MHSLIGSELGTDMRLHLCRMARLCDPVAPGFASACSVQLVFILLTSSPYNITCKPIPY
jgi:hypothetical protein